MSDERQTLTEAMQELSSAEEFLEFFEIDFDRRVVQVNRLHILQRFHDYLASADSAADETLYARHQRCLTRAYADFVASNAQEQKALRVFKAPEPGFVSLDEFNS